MSARKVSRRRPALLLGAGAVAGLAFAAVPATSGKIIVDAATQSAQPSTLTAGQLRSEKGECELHWEDFQAHAEGQLVLGWRPAPRI